ncbi:unnamed protein product [Periconia digitata]|uniref:Uncharacterized protein n=1 Tax=Periconia digitata TaxID=1303443 RepID=A0A9W4UBK5_9PLEO|nr:unnamed protein product [Periconia digitata]
MYAEQRLLQTVVQRSHIHGKIGKRACEYVIPEYFCKASLDMQKDHMVVKLIVGETTHNVELTPLLLSTPRAASPLRMRDR